MYPEIRLFLEESGNPIFMQENERKRFSLFILTLSINMEEVTLVEY